MEALIINLKTSLDRRKFQEKQLKKLGIEHSLIVATSINDISDDTYQNHYYDWVRPLRKPELACYFSHRSVWEKIIKDNKPYLILEDDALLSRHTKDLLDSVENLTDIDLVNLETRMRKKFLSRSAIKIGANVNLFRLYQDRTGAAAYVLFPSGAKKLLECEQKKGVAIADAHITGCLSLKSYQVEPVAAVQLDICSLYGIDHEESIKTATSSISIIEKNKGSIRFKVKRLLTQTHLGIRQIALLAISTRRFVKINKNEF